MIVLLSAVLSVLLHVLLGWEATVLASVIAGVWSTRWHWLAGGAAVALGWSVAVVYSAAVAPAAFRVFIDTLGALAGNIPGEAIVGLTVFLGGVLGILGGGLGRSARLLVEGAP